MKFSNLFLLTVVILMGCTTATFAQTEKVTNQETVVALKTTETLTTKVKGVTCSSDLKTIAASVEKLEGVTACITGKAGPTSTFEITYDPAVIKVAAIHAAIENTGGCKNPADRPYTIKL